MSWFSLFVLLLFFNSSFSAVRSLLPSLKASSKNSCANDGYGFMKIFRDHIKRYCPSSKRGFHHDYQRNLEKKGLVRYYNRIPGPGGSFGAGVIIGSTDYGFKSFFPPDWHYKKIAAVVKAICVNRYKDGRLNRPHSQQKDVFDTVVEGIPLRIVFDRENRYVLSAYPLIGKPNSAYTVNDQNLKQDKLNLRKSG